MLNLSQGLKISSRKWDIPPTTQKHITISDVHVYRPKSKAILPERAYEMQHREIFLLKTAEIEKLLEKPIFFAKHFFRANIQQNSLNV